MRTAGELPAAALLRKYDYEGAYTDCYSTDIAAKVSLPEYVEAFYTTAVFKLERLILKWLVDRPSTDSEANRLARGEVESFAAWSVEGRAQDQLLLCDFQQRTRSWLMVASIDGGQATRLYFGSAVVPVRTQSGAVSLGSSYQALLGFHKLYSRVLLRAAAARVRRRLRRPDLV
jgi:hypothetical protein